MSEHVDITRARSRRILDQLSVGERFMLMFGRGELKRDPLRVEWKVTTTEKAARAQEVDSHG